MLGTYAIGACAARGRSEACWAASSTRSTAPLVGSFRSGDVSISKWRTAVIVITVLVMVGCWLLLARTKFGLQVRASLENPALARASGISTEPRLRPDLRVRAPRSPDSPAGLMVPIYSLSADMGVPFLIKSFLAVMLGRPGVSKGPWPVRRSWAAAARLCPGSSNPWSPICGLRGRHRDHEVSAARPVISREEVDRWRTRNSKSSNGCSRTHAGCSCSAPACSAGWSRWAAAAISTTRRVAGRPTRSRSASPPILPVRSAGAASPMRTWRRW